MSDPIREQGAGEGLDSLVARPSALVFGTPPPSRRIDRSETRGNGWSHWSDRSSARRYRRSESDKQMNFRERLVRELELIYQELLKTPPIILLIISCLAVLLVGAVFLGATR